MVQETVHQYVDKPFPGQRRAQLNFAVLCTVPKFELYSIFDT